MSDEDMSARSSRHSTKRHSFSQLRIDLLPTYLFVEDSEPKFAIFCNIVVVSALALLGDLKTFREPSTCILGSIFSDQEKPVIR